MKTVTSAVVLLGAFGICAMSPTRLAHATCSQSTSNESVCSGGVQVNSASGGTGLYGEDDSGTGNGVVGWTSSGIGVYGNANGSNGVGVVGSGKLYGVEGIGPTGLYGASNAVSGGYGVEGYAAGTNVGVYADAASGYGVYAKSSGADAGHFVASSANAGVYGGNTSTANTARGVFGDLGYVTSGSGSGVYGTTASSGGFGVQGNNSSTGTGVYGTSGGYGVWGASTGSTGVHGSSTNGDGVTGVGNYGVSGTSSAGSEAFGVGVYGADNSDGDQSIGVWGHSSSSYGIGVQGDCTNTPDCWAGYFSGNVYATGTFSSSDSRLKKDIEPLSGAIDQLLKLKGVTFRWKEPAKHGDHSETQIGFIAQDVEEVFPGWVQTDKDGFKAVDVHQIEALQVESIRALKAANDELRAQMKADHATVVQMKDELDSLKAGRDPMTGDRGMLWLAGMVFAVGGGVIVTRKQSEKRA